jgi:ribosome modulation factor
VATKKALTLAYNAGRAALSEPPERRSADACPFGPGEERDEWLRGFEDALDEQPDPAELKRQIREAKAK